MADHFNKLLLQRLEEIGTRLLRLEDRLNHVINQKADETELKDLKEDLNALREEVHTQE